MPADALPPGAAATPPAPKERHPLLAVAWMMGALVSFASMAIAGREASFEVDTFELMMYRSFIGIAIMVTALTAMRRWGDVRSDRMGLHFARNVSHFVGQNAWFYAITVLPLAQVVAIEFASPIWVALFAPLFLGERLTRVRLFTVLMGFSGILIAARPDFSTIQPGILTAALASVGFAGSILTTKLLTRTESILCILFWLTVMQAVFGIVCAGIDGDIAWPSLATWPFLVAIGIAGLSAHLCLTTALSLAPATVIVPFEFLRLPVIAFLGALIYSEVLEVWVALGAAIIFAANYINTWVEARARRRARRVQEAVRQRATTSDAS